MLQHLKWYYFNYPFIYKYFPENSYSFSVEEGGGEGGAFKTFLIVRGIILKGFKSIWRFKHTYVYDLTQGFYDDQIFPNCRKALPLIIKHINITEPCKFIISNIKYLNPLKKKNDLRKSINNNKSQDKSWKISEIVFFWSCYL